MGTAPSVGAFAKAGGLQPLPSPGAPAGARLDPSSTWRGWAGCHPKGCIQLLFPPTTLGKLCLFGCITPNHPRRRRSPGEMLQLKFLPGETPSATEQPRSQEQEQRHQICSQLEMLSERGLN